MTLEAVQTILEAHKAELEAFGVRELLLFGSTARNEARADSDVDFLVELEHYTLHNFMGLKFALEEWLGKNVDLGTKRSLKPILQNTLRQDLRRVA